MGVIYEHLVERRAPGDHPSALMDPIQSGLQLDAVCHRAIAQEQRVLNSCRLIRGSWLSTRQLPEACSILDRLGVNISIHLITRHVSQGKIIRRSMIQHLQNLHIDHIPRADAQVVTGLPVVDDLTVDEQLEALQGHQVNRLELLLELPTHMQSRRGLIEATHWRDAYLREAIVWRKRPLPLMQPIDLRYELEVVQRRLLTRSCSCRSR